MEPIEWHGPAFKYTPKTPLWYWGTIILALILMALGFWQRNFFLVIFVIIAELMVLFWGNQEPDTVKFRIDEKGIAIGQNKLYNYADLEGFAIVKTEDEFDDLVIKRGSILNPYLKIALDKNHSLKAKTALNQKLMEEDYKESFLDWLGEWLGF